MTLRDAREILGLGPDEDPRPSMDQLRVWREHLAAMVRNAPNEDLAIRHQQTLVEYDRALATIRENLEILGLWKPEAELVCLHSESSTRSDSNATGVEDEEEAPESRSSLRAFAIVLLMLAAGVGCGGWLYLEYIDRQLRGQVERVSTLEQRGNLFIENRRWDDAAAAFAEIERLSPQSDIARLGYARIEAGRAEEESQFIAYWTGEARAALDSGRWEDAEDAARKVIDRFPSQNDAATILFDITAAREAVLRAEEIRRIQALIDAREPEAAVASASQFAEANPEDPEATELLSLARAALEKWQADQSRAKELLARAIEVDTGEFDAKALEWLREASLLAPQDESIAAHFEKMAAYSRTIRVPEDVAELSDALADARENDRILLGAGTWQGTFIINATIELQGAGPGETFIECPAATGCALTIGPEALGARISGITFRQLGFDAGEDRYSAALVRGGRASFIDCHFIEASGHGLAVIEGARVEIQRCRFRENGWNGIAATGLDSDVQVAECHMIDNFGHGIEAWDGARISIINCRAENNSGNGIHLDTHARAIRIEDSEIIRNREFGIVLTKADEGILSANRIRNNLLGGVVVRFAASGIRMEENQILSNGGHGLILESGLDPAIYRSNTLNRNSGSQLHAGIDLSTPAAPASQEENPIDKPD